MITFAIEALILIVLLVVLYVLNRTERFSKVVYDDKVVEESVNELAEETIETMEEYTNIALFGLDTRQAGSLGKGNRSDTIMVASVNNKTKDVKIVSVYRDSYLNLANDKYRKCNEAYSVGGPEQAVAMLNMNMDLKIDHYMSVDFLAVSEVVDLLGGVEIDVDEYEIEHLNNYTVETSKVTGKKTNKLTSTGVQKLDGVQATSYCRIRYTAGDDFKRTERQREVLEAIARKAKTMSPSQLDSIVKAAFFTCLEIVLPTLTLYHGTSCEASTNITRPNEWLVGNGAYAGYGIYFAPSKSTALHYSRGVVIICRVTLGRIENLNLHPYICASWVAKRGHSITKWAINEGITTVEWWRTTGTYRWWEYCMVDHSAGYDHPWRIRPLYREDAGTGKYQRTWGGVGLWCTAIVKDWLNDV